MNDLNSRVSVVKGILSLLLAFVLVNGLLLAPRWLSGGASASAWIAVEAAVVVGLCAFLPRSRWALTVIAGAALMLVALTVTGLADAAARLSLARPLNLYLDLYLAGAVHNLLVGTLGSVRAALALFGAGVGVLLLALAAAHLLHRARVPAGRWSAVGIGALLAALLSVGLWGEHVHPAASKVALPAVDLIVEQVHYMGRMLAERETFSEEMASKRAGYSDHPGLLQRLEGRDVLLAFIESYGVTALDDPLYAPIVLPRLGDMADRLEAAGLHLASGRLVAPSQGGQSWLGHGTLLSGLWLDNQLRYELLLTSVRETLIDDFRHAGYRTVALMPAITLAWPEGERLGFDRIFAHRDIGYAGPALNWVTMPDQFTWSYLQETVRPGGGDPRPLFATVGLISSHAPWTPILPVLDDWDAIGDGAIFAPWDGAGEPPEELWRDSDRVREHFALSIDYAVHAMTAYAERYLDEGTLLIALGDHQPAPLITGDGASQDVPVHVISGDPELLEPFLDWGFVPGAVPASDGSARGMDAFRDWFVRAFSVSAMSTGQD